MKEIQNSCQFCSEKNNDQGMDSNITNTIQQNPHSNKNKNCCTHFQRLSMFWFFAHRKVRIVFEFFWNFECFCIFRMFWFVCLIESPDTNNGIILKTKDPARPRLWFLIKTKNLNRAWKNKKIVGSVGGVRNGKHRRVVFSLLAFLLRFTLVS